ncbi:hypothetical protein GGQ68_002417 [Sagittula marina]|uniref:Uncharacterized protein n=1 Tax=Sagittula marina TaxID=943940 RepID=A0A7W6DNY0_9RHOB|nr:hypothetical protein [Sagittula marina]MBB3986079.1 hypothetical protein [Sagittula marina]
MKNAMMTVADATARIEQGATLVIAGDEKALARLPKGQWIGGTAVYFVTETGARQDHEMVFVTEVAEGSASRTRFVPTEDLSSLADQQFENGATMILIPAFSDAHQRFALDGAGYPDIFAQPLIGWISGVALEDIGEVAPKVFDGATGHVHEDGAVLLHVEMPAGRVAEIDILNLFEQDRESPTILFRADGFSATTAIINGEEVNLAKWVLDNNINTQRPLVANYAGAMINVSFQNVDASAGKCSFFAPVVEGVEYRIARNPGDYAKVFASRANGDGANEMSCNCILNYIFGELEGKTTGTFTGPATFGEIAYILLNQTMVRLRDVAMKQSNVA